MELQSLNPKSQIVHIESQDDDDDESGHKRVKKKPSVRFEPTATARTNDNYTTDSDDDAYLEDMSEQALRNEINLYLPSNTIGRNKYSHHLKSKALTVPRIYRRATMTASVRPRPHSFYAKNSKFLTNLNLSKINLVDDVDDGNYSFSLTEEEKQRELENIRNIPMRMSEKRRYRDAILDSMPDEGSRSHKAMSRVKDFWLSVKRSSEKFQLWNDLLKKIEGLHGTGVVSYFVFLRWLILLNTILFILCFFFITVPHELFPHKTLQLVTLGPNQTVITEKLKNRLLLTEDIKLKPMNTKNLSISLKNEDLLSSLGSYFNHYLPEEFLDVTLNYARENFTFEERRNVSAYCEARYVKDSVVKTDILSVAQDFLQGTGWMQSTLLFLGYYSASEISFFGYPYNIPVAILTVLLVSFLICLMMMIRYSSHGVQEAIITRKSSLVYSNILFCSWDYCIEDSKSSQLRHRSIIQEIKSTLAEDRRRKQVKGWSKALKLKIYSFRVIINIFVIGVLCASYYLIYLIVNYQLKELQSKRLKDTGVQTFFVQYLTPICITCLNIFVPVIFNAIVSYEMYDTHTQINVALIRIVFLRLSSVFVLVFLLYQQILCEPKDQCNQGINTTCRSPICWETYVGQQLYKLVVTDFFVYLMLFFAYDLPRDLIVRSCNNKVTQMIGRQVFDLPNQVLSLVYSQTLCWLGVIYSPLLPMITVIKFFVLIYVKKYLVLRFCVPSTIPYKASRSNAMFIVILLISFFSIMIIHGYSVSRIEPSPACSPFRFFLVMVDAIANNLMAKSTALAAIVNFIFSGVFLIPAIIFLCIVIYYYGIVLMGHQHMAKILRAQITLEGRDKQFLLNRLTYVARGCKE